MEELPKIDKYLERLGHWMQAHEQHPKLKMILFKANAALELRKSIHDHVGNLERAIKEQGIPTGLLIELCKVAKIPITTEEEVKAKALEILIQHQKDAIGGDRCKEDERTLEVLQQVMADIDQLKKEIINERKQD